MLAARLLQVNLQDLQLRLQLVHPFRRHLCGGEAGMCRTRAAQLRIDMLQLGSEHLDVGLVPLQLFMQLLL